LAEGVAVLVHRVEAHRDVLVDRLAGIERDALVVIGADLAGGFAVWTLAAAGISDGLFARPDRRPFRRCARLTHHRD